jgi:rod shape-determining protein MreD
VRRAALAAALLLLAILIQVTLLTNLPWPGAAGPDLVLVVVVALALTGGPVEGMLGGFCAGLALDVAPPATHLIGQYALVFCLVGYGCGRVGSHLSESVWAPIGVVAVGSAAGELLFALTGMIFGDLDVTWSAVGHVLPASVLYDVLLSPFVLYAVIRARAMAAPALAAQGLASFSGGSASQRVMPGLAGAAALFSGSGAVLRDSGTGRVPRLKARTLRAGSGQGGSASGTRPAKRPPARPVHVNFSSAAGGSAAGARPAKRPPSRPVNLHLGSRGNRSAVTRPQGSWPRGSWQRGGGVPARAFSRGNRSAVTRPQGSWQRGGGVPAKAFSRPVNAFGRSSALGDGQGGKALRPSSRGPRLRGGVMQGGSASTARAVSVRFNARPARPVQLRLGSGRRRDGAIGGSVLGRRSPQRRDRAIGGWIFGRRSARRRDRAIGGWMLGRRGRGRGPRAGKVHTPRFRGTKGSALGGRRTPASTLDGRRVFGRRRSWWRIFGKRSGGFR